MGEVLVAVAERLREVGFVPKELRVPKSEERSLFTAVRHVHGMRVDDAEVCYWNWQELRAHLVQVWAALDAEATERHGRPIQAHVWTFTRGRTLDEVLDLVEAADRRLGPRPLIKGVRRPDAAGMMAANKPRGAMASTLGVLHVASGQQMGRLIGRVLEGAGEGWTAEDVQRRLDALAMELGCIPGESDTSEIPKLLSRYLDELIEHQRKLEAAQKLEEPRWTFVRFLAHVIEAGRNELSDEQLLAWLRQKSPEAPPRPRRAQAPTSLAPEFQAFAVIAPSRVGAERSFAAIDVETANHDRASICAIGAVVLEDGEEVARKRWLCQPPPGFEKFSPFNTGIHGIRAGDVKDAPTFAEVVGELGELIAGTPVVAHNAAFDVGAIRRACLASGAPVPEFHYACTMAMARASLKFPTYGLAWCSDYFGITLDHNHDPSSDASAAASLALALLDVKGVEGLDDLVEACRLRWGYLSASEWMRSLLLVPSSGRRPPEANPDADPTHPLYGVGVSLTGDLVALTRSQAFERLAELGGQGLANVTRATQMLVVGDLNPAVLRPGSSITGKMQHAFELQAKGQPIEVISGYDFLAMLD